MGIAHSSLVEKENMIPKTWFDMTETEWQKERKRIRELQGRHFREKGDERE